jgi:hypothetical protein
VATQAPVIAFDRLASGTGLAGSASEPERLDRPAIRRITTNARLTPMPACPGFERRPESTRLGLPGLRVGRDGTCQQAQQPSHDGAGLPLVSARSFRHLSAAGNCFQDP